MTHNNMREPASDTPDLGFDLDEYPRVAAALDAEPHTEMWEDNQGVWQPPTVCRNCGLRLVGRGAVVPGKAVGTLLCPGHRTVWVATDSSDGQLVAVFTRQEAADQYTTDHPQVTTQPTLTNPCGRLEPKHTTDLKQDERGRWQPTPNNDS